MAPASVSGAEVDPEELVHAVAVGTVDARSARLWIRAPGRKAGELTLVLLLPDGSDRHLPIRGAPAPAADHTLVVDYPAHFPDGPPLAPLTRYRFRVQGADGRLIGAGGFQTAPAGPEDTPERFCFAFASCHQPFETAGGVDEASRAMLEAARQALIAHDAKFLLMVGDQVYADEPLRFSLHGPEHQEDRLSSALLSASPDEIRRRYHRQYRRSWAVPGFMALQSDRPTHCTLDDHEIVDNWGSDPAHAEPGWQRVAAGALDAFFDYQGARSWPAGTRRPAAFYRSFVYGTIAVFLMDVRSERQAVPGQEQMVSRQQLAALARFLRENSGRHALFVVAAVPVAHVPGWLNTVGDKLLARASDMHDRWSSPPLRRQRDDLLAMLADHRRAHPGQRLALLSGDIHAGWAATLRPPGGQPLVQFVSSALTNHNASMSGALARALLEITRPLEREVAGLLVSGLAARPGSTNPYGGLNLGLVEVERIDRHRSRLRFKLIGADSREPSRPHVVFESEPVDT